VSSAIRFVLDGRVHAVERVEPTRTVLQHLREDLGRTGTKEGCAEGDCGACTTVVAERVVDAGDERLRFRAVNACIRFLPTLDGKALFTVQGLECGGAMHPAQQAMVDCHGSQCGFCTPGIVMSLFALAKNDPHPDRRAINDALAGNLCRCTGYRPIVDAAQRMMQLVEANDTLRARQRAREDMLLVQLRSLERPALVSFAGASGSFHAPRTIAELCTLRAALPDARLVAGTTDVGLWVTKRHQALGDLIYTGEVSELQRVGRDETHLEIGAAVTVADAAALLVREYADFAELFRRFGSPPIRNAATLGGNIANGSPVGDSMPGLIALGAELVLRCGNAQRTLALEDFYLAYRQTALSPGEFVQSVRIPLARPGLQFRTYKLSKRFDQDISALCAAFAATIEGGTVVSIRIAYGGMAATPKRAVHTEKAVAGRPWSEDTVRAAMATLGDDYAPISDMRASLNYRRRTAANLLMRFYLETNGSGTATRLYDFELAPEARDEPVAAAR
jgi:xanthine dehydrogenase small subunit